MFTASRLQVISAPVQADLLEHLELGVQIPGQSLAHGDVQEVAAALASALCQVLTAPRLLANARSMQQELQREDGVAIAVAVIQASAAHPQPPLLDARSLQVWYPALQPWLIVSIEVCLWHHSGLFERAYAIYCRFTQRPLQCRSHRRVSFR